jgi:hypothetical protein
MDQQETFDLTGLTEEQKVAIEHFIEKQKGRYFFSSTPQMMIKDFLSANAQMKDTDPATAERGRIYEAALRERCLAPPPPTSPPEH